MFGSQKQHDEIVGANDADLAIVDNMETFSDETTEMTKKMSHLYETLLKHIDAERNEIIIGKFIFYFEFSPLGGDRLKVS